MDGPEPSLEALYRPLAAPAWVLGHLGQSLDGRIATRAGASHYVTGEANLDHLHRLRALADAVIVGAATAASDDPRLTVRRVAGENPVRVVLGPRRPLPAGLRLFRDGAAPTLVVAAEAAGAETVAREAIGQAELMTVAHAAEGLDLAAVVAALRQRGLRRLLVEGGGVTVSRFLAAGLLDRLQICVAPLFIGAGRPGIALPPLDDLARAPRPPCRTFAMGDDVLFDLELTRDRPG